MDLPPIIQLIDFFGKTKLIKLAEQIGLIKRQRKLMPDTILKVFTFGLLGSDDPSLKVIASQCQEIEPNLRITKQAIHQKLGEIATFLKLMFTLAMDFTANKLLSVETAKILTQFEDIKIYDSTRISLPDKLAQVWPGLGGRNSNSSLKIQAGYSLLSKAIVNLELTKSPGTDVSYNNKIIEQTNENELVITDLGYFDKKFFDSIANKGAYFLSRVRKNTVIGTQKEGSNKAKRAEFLKVLKDKQVIDIQAFIGSENSKKFKCRLVAIRLPEDIVNEKRRKAHKKAKSKGKQLSKYEIELLAWHIVISNVPSSMLSAKAACELYRARWQIELIFKTCKSYFKIDKVGNCGQEQLECLIYGRLITILMTFRIYSYYYPKIYNEYDRGISILLFMKLLSEKALKIAENLISIKSSIWKITDLFQRVAEESIYEKRDRKTTLQRMMEFSISAVDYQNSA
ncbi:IS4 family transposase [Fuchsiella alkaliacetigena]|uniref:IS4 family transposase n=1 Tax=Fuchsiella alkaliacetigena TaxID=957042 RepID=UPI00200B58AB|nr:IS4 family transposase [Fuchsiella alkaliacetigena]MCK8826122.1 IS4 family transposase [Fuchsiella alkaliacetigena]